MRCIGRAVNTDETSLSCPPLTSYYTDQFLTGQGPVLVCGPRVGDLWVYITEYFSLVSQKQTLGGEDLWASDLLRKFSLINKWGERRDGRRRGRSQTRNEI